MYSELILNFLLQSPLLVIYCFGIYFSLTNKTLFQSASKLLLLAFILFLFAHLFGILTQGLTPILIVKFGFSPSSNYLLKVAFGMIAVLKTCAWIIVLIALFKILPQRLKSE